MSDALDLTEQAVEDAIGPLDTYAQQCHAASIALVKSGILGQSRVARGSCHGVGGQHSWVVLGDDCYDDRATIVDVTAWSYNRDLPRVWVTTMKRSPHRPHGWGIVWDGAMPFHHGGETVTIKDEIRARMSYRAAYFLQQIEPLDHRGWAMVGDLPVGGWDAGEIYEAMDDSGLGVYVPVDKLGMLTDRNPGGLYLAGDER